MDLELMRTFLEVERLRHFARAADELFVTQAAVSARIKLLEESLGARLFVREKRHIDLTPEGHRFKRYAERLLVEWRKARHDISLGTKGEQLAVGGTYRVWDAAMQDWLHRVHESIPDLALILESHTPDTLVRRLIDGQLDLGFILEPPQLDSLNLEKVAELKLILVSTEPQVDADAALQSKFVAIDWGLGFSTEVRRRYPDAPEPSFRFSQSSSAIGFIKTFGGSAFVSNRAVIEDLDDGSLFLVPGVVPIERTVYAAFPVRTNRQALIDAVIDHFPYRVAVPRSSGDSVPN